MLALGSMLVSWAAGWSAARLLLPRILWRPAWLRWILELSLGWAAGTTLSAAVFFLSVWSGAPVVLVPIIEIAILAACLYFARGPREESAAPPPYGWNWALRLGVLCCLVFFLLQFSASTSALPDGEWDAQFIWNVRGKFLAGGPDVWRGAVTGAVEGKTVGVAHPDYPLLLSSFLGRAWALGRSSGSAVPIAAALLYALALAGLLGAALAWLTSETIGLIAMMALVSCELFAYWAPAQYADIPLAFYGLAALALLAVARRAHWPTGVLLFAGAMAGAAAWTKNEGIVLLAFLLAAALFYGGRRALAFTAAGAFPIVALAAACKLLLALNSTADLPLTVGAALSRVGQLDRWWMVARSFARNLFAVSHWWAHPVLLLGGAAVVLGLAPRAERLAQWRLFLAPSGLLAADTAVFLVTKSDLAWLLDTTNDRLILQVLPSLMFVFALALRPPADSAPVTLAAVKKQKKAKRTRSRG
jgi:hypothetical protein